ncbi:hypothetical protein [Vibrio scophthalmi]|nr:hypothetical protein [Vibrio scophthalmi]
MEKVELLKQISSFIEDYSLISDNGDDFSCQLQMTDEIKKMLSAWESEDLLLTINDIDTQHSPDASMTTVGKEYCVSFALVNLRDDGVHVYFNWEQFFSYSKNQSFVPESFYLIDDKSLFIGDIENLSGDLKHYINTVSLIDMLRDVADHIETIDGSVIPNVVMLHKNRLEIPCQYQLKDIQSGLDGITHICKWINDKAHNDQKISIFKTALYDFLKSVKKGKRFEYLLTHFGEFSSQVTENYELYVSEFSFDDVRLEYQEKKRDYILKINDTFGSIQTKALGIPVSIAFIAMRLSTARTTEYDSSTDTLLFVAACIYGLMMWLLIQNQKHSLKSIESEYKGQIIRLKKEYPEQHDKIKDEFKDLDNRCKTQRSQLNLFLFLIVVLVYVVYEYLGIQISSVLLQAFEYTINFAYTGWEYVLAKLQYI